MGVFKRLYDYVKNIKKIIIIIIIINNTFQRERKLVWNCT